MNRMIIKSRVNGDGMLHLSIPVSADDANQEVQVTIEPVAPAALTQDEWYRFILSTAGSIADPTFMRHEQGVFEQREELP